MITSLPIRSLLACCAFLLPASLTAHEFWIEPEPFTVAPNGQVTAQFKNGENFSGIKLGFFERRSRTLRFVWGGIEDAITPRLGDVPAISLPAPGEGLMILAHETEPQSITYDTWEDFARFADHKDFPDIQNRHTQRGLPEAGFDELYTRHAKALVAIGHGQGADREMGLATEFVALSNPYRDDLSSGMRVRLLYDGAPRPDAQIEIFARAPDGAVTVTTQKTNTQGEAVIAVQRGYDYLLDAVVLAEPSEKADHAWDTLWAALTFHVP